MKLDAGYLCLVVTLLACFMLGVMWILDSHIKKRQGKTREELQRGFEVKTITPGEPVKSSGTETQQQSE